MPRSYSIHIPKSHWPYIEGFLGVSLERLQALIDYISQAGPTSETRGLSEECASNIGLSADTVEGILEIVVNLKNLQRSLDRTVEEIITDVSDFLESNDYPEWEERQSKAWEERKCFLKELLSEDNAIEVMAKARRLLYEFQSVLLDCAILTDTRHIYDKNASKMMGGLIVHTLSLDFIEGREYRQIHVVMSSDDIKKLVSQLQRAQRKAEIAQRMLNQVGIPDLTPEKDI